jgi:uncharacterized protein YicC (UPF0701 family)
MSAAASPYAGRAPLIDGPEIGTKVLTALEEVMEELLLLIQEETRLVKEGRLRAASELAATKEQKSADYTKLVLYVRDQMAPLKQHVPQKISALIRRHDLFRAEVQINLAVLATARDVAEDLMRSVASEVGQAQVPSGYGRGGAPIKGPEVSAKGIAINRNL